MTLTRESIESGPVFDTPLHRPIELIDHPTTRGLVIYHPDGPMGHAALHSDVFVDTYDRR